MKKGLVVAGVLACTVFLRAQDLPGVEVTAEPMHHLAFRNQYVRVFQVEVPAGSSTLMHRHRHDYLYVVLGAAQISNEVAGKPPATMKVQDGQVEFAVGNFAHIMRDLGSAPFRNVTIELLQDKQARKTPPPKWDEERGLHVLDGGTEDVMFVKDGVRVSEFELQPGGVIPKHRQAGARLLVAVSDINLCSEVVGRGASKVELKAGDVTWVSGGFNHTLSNAGKQEAKFVALEFH